MTDQQLVAIRKDDLERVMANINRDVEGLVQDEYNRLSQALANPSVTVEGELELHTDYEGQQIYVNGNDLWDTLDEALTATSRRNIYEASYGPCLVTVTSIKEKSDE